MGLSNGLGGHLPQGLGQQQRFPGFLAAFPGARDRTR